MINHFKLLIIMIIFLGCFSIANTISGNDQKKELKYEDIDWQNYRWWEKWHNFNPDVYYKESAKVDEYLKLEAEGKLPKNVHIYRNDPLIDSYRKILLDQKSKLPELMQTNLEYYKEKIIQDDYEFDSFTFNIFAGWINPPCIDFLLWLYEKYKDSPDNYNSSSEGLCIMAFWMMKDPDLFKEEVLYFKNKVVPVFWERIKTGEYDIWILDTLYRMGYEKEVLPIITEKSKTERFEYQLLCKEYFSFKKNLRIAVAKEEIEQIVLKLLDNLDDLCWDTQYECILFLYLYGDLERHVDYLFKIIDMKRYQYIGHYMQFFEHIQKNEKIKKFFVINLDKPEFKDFHEKMITYISSFN